MPETVTARGQHIRRTDPTAAVAVARLISLAFTPLAVSRWLVPDTAARSAILPAFFRILVDHALTAGTVYTTADGLAAAVWLPVTAAGPAVEPDNYEARLRAVSGQWADRFLTFEAALARRRPRASYHYLALLAVHPRVHDRGRGSALLVHHQTKLDATGLGAYLEATDARASKLFARHGYRTMDPGPFRLPDGGPPVRPMWRPPAQVAFGRPTAPYLLTSPYPPAAAHPPTAPRTAP